MLRENKLKVLHDLKSKMFFKPLTNKYNIPTITKYRKYCSTCKTYTLHDDMICDVCDTIYIETVLSDISTDVIAKQQKRYKNKQSNYAKNMLSSMFIGSTQNMFLDEVGNYAIQEDDAGYLTEVETRNAEQRQIKFNNFNEQQAKQFIRKYIIESEIKEIFTTT